MSATGSTRFSTWTTFAIVEAARDLHDRVDLADVAEKLVAQPLALARAAHQPRDVDEVDRGRDDAVGVHDAVERLQARSSGTVTTPTFGSMVQKG